MRPRLLLAMDWAGARQVREALPDCYIVLRHWEPDGQQVDWSAAPEAEAQRWAGLLRSRLVAGVHDCAVGPNEYVGNDPARFEWADRFEEALCHLVQAAGYRYAALSVAVGNVDDIGAFPRTLASADFLAYHCYCKPGAAAVDPEDEPWWLNRPFRLWWPRCQAQGLRFPPLLAAEIGTYQPWTERPRLAPRAYAEMCCGIIERFDGWRRQGMPVLGGCVFAFGAEGAMGQRWNLDGSEAVEVIRRYNAEHRDPGDLQAWAAPAGGGEAAPTVWEGEGFAALAARYGALMGAPLAPAQGVHPSGDVVQCGSGGTAFWHKASNTPLFVSNAGEVLRLD
jgi:hypothetical protein